MNRIYEPKNDGINHINVYTKGKTELGQLLTNMADTPFVHPKFGQFRTVEGLWYYLKTGRMYEQLRKMDGFTSKKFGQSKMPRKDYNDKLGISDEFKENILEGIRCKLRQNKDILIKLVETDLPLSHYYVYGNNTKPLPEYDWILVELERIKDVSKDYVKKLKKRKAIKP